WTAGSFDRSARATMREYIVGLVWYCPRCGRTADAAGACPQDGAGLAAGDGMVGQIIGEYTVLARLGGGAFGTVYRAIHPRSGLGVAIKVIDQPSQPADERSLIEARATAAIRHPNVVTIYDFGLTPDRKPYVVMEL